MKLNFVIDKTKNLNSFLEKAKKNFAFLPLTNKEITNRISKYHEIVYLKKDNEIAGGGLWYEKEQNRGHIYILFISEKYRKKNYSKKLIDYLTKRIRDCSLNEVSAFVDRNNNYSLRAFLKDKFEVNGFLIDKNLLLLNKCLRNNSSTDYFSSIFFGQNIDAKIKNFKHLLKNPRKTEEELNKLDFNNLNLYKNMKSLNGLNYLKFLADFNNGSISEKALNKLGSKLEEISKIESIPERIKLLKYVAIHSKKETSKKAIKKLVNEIENLQNINNQELKASTLRYISLHSDGKIQKKAVDYLHNIPSQQIKKTSLDYLSTHLK